MISPRNFVKQELEVIRRLFGKVGSAPNLFACEKDGERVLFPIGNYRDSREKELMFQTLKMLVKELMPDVVIYMSEAWSVKLTKPSIAVLLPPSKHPNRVEVLIVQIEFKTGEQYSCMAEILRDGKPRLAEFEVSNCMMYSSRFVDFYPRTTH